MTIPTERQADLLRLMRAMPGATLRELARRMERTPGRIHQVLVLMRSHGWTAQPLPPTWTTTQEGARALRIYDGIERARARLEAV